MKIQRTTMGQLSLGEGICDVDDEDLTTDEAINAAYVAEDQDWHTVRHIAGHADVGTVTLAMYNGETYTARTAWDATTWRLVEDDGVTPIVNDADGD